MSIVPYPPDPAAHGFGPPVASIPFDRFRTEVLGFYSIRAKGTRTKLRQVLGIVAELVGPAGTTADLTPALVARFIASRPPETSNNTTLSLLRCLRAVSTYAERSGYVRLSPFRFRNVGDWVRPSKSRRPRQHISIEEVRALLIRARVEIERKKHHSQASAWAVWRCRRLHALAATVAYTGLRRNEALFLRVEDIDLAGGFLAVVPRGNHRLKTASSERVLPLAPELAAVLRDWVPYAQSEWLFPNSTHRGPWTGGSPGWKPLDRLKALGKRAGIPDLTFLALRHTFVTIGITHWGLSAEQVARLMGHTNVRTQDHYLHDDRPALKRLADRFDFGGAGPDGGRS